MEDCGCRKTEKIICGMEWENVVANGRLPSLVLYVIPVDTPREI